MATILLLFSLSTISAANQTINSTSTGGIAQGITNTGHEETLFLQPGTYNKTGQDTNIMVSKNITIQGNGSTDSVIIDARGLSRIFSIANNINVTFIHLTFTNGYNTPVGGAIWNNYGSSTMTFVNCTFPNNVTGTGGGRIYNRGNTTVIGSNFRNNAPVNNYDGGIYNNGSLVVIGSNFVANVAFIDGGGILSDRNSTCTIISSNFTNNTSFWPNGNGGGFSSRGTGKNAIIDSNFLPI